MLVVVGGHSRNIGKTSVVAGIVAGSIGLNWTAVKITQYGHGVCSTEGESCDCAVEYDHPYALSQERDPCSGTDTSRYLAAGAAKSYWLRTATGQLGNALPALHRIRGEAENLILESNSVMRFWKPDLYIVVLDFAIADFKESSLLYLDRADALVMMEPGRAKPEWSGVSSKLWAGKPQFPALPPAYASPDLVAFVREHAELASNSSR